MSGRVTIVRGWANGATQSSQAIQFGRSVRVSEFTSHPSANRHVLTATEGLTKWIEAKAVRSATAKIAAQFLRDIITGSVRPS